MYQGFPSYYTSRRLQDIVLDYNPVHQSTGGLPGVESILEVGTEVVLWGRTKVR